MRRHERGRGRHRRPRAATSSARRSSRRSTSSTPSSAASCPRSPRGATPSCWSATVADALADAGAGWDDLDGVAVTTGPGLIGALLVGLAAAKAIAYARRLPLTPVDHLQGHLAAAYALGVEAPFVCLTASGGHTLLAVVERGRRVPRRRPHARRRRRRGLRQGRPPARPALPRRPRARPAGRARRPRARGLSAQPAAGPRLQLQRPQDGAAVLPARARGRRRPTEARRAYDRRLLPGGDRRPAREQDGALRRAGGPAPGRGRRRRGRELAAAPPPHRGLRASAASRPSCRRSRCAPTTPAMVGLAAGHLEPIPWPRLPRPRRLRRRAGPGRPARAAAGRRLRGGAQPRARRAPVALGGSRRSG